MASLQLIQPATQKTEGPHAFLDDAKQTQSFDRIAIEAGYPAQTALFAEGQRSQGVMVIVSGRVKLSTTSADGRTLIVRVAGEGDVLGLSATVVGRPYELTAETLESCRIKLVPRDSFLRWLRSNPELAFRIAEELAEEYNSTCQQLRSMLLSHTATQRLARILLELAANGVAMKNEVRVQLSLTHQEIAEMIGTSRETVTRLLASFRQKNIIHIEGSTLVLRNREALREIGHANGNTLNL